MGIFIPNAFTPDGDDLNDTWQWSMPEGTLRSSQFSIALDISFGQDRWPLQDFRDGKGCFQVARK